MIRLPQPRAVILNRRASGAADRLLTYVTTAAKVACGNSTPATQRHPKPQGQWEFYLFWQPKMLKLAGRGTQGESDGRLLAGSWAGDFAGYASDAVVGRPIVRVCPDSPNMSETRRRSGFPARQRALRSLCPERSPKPKPRSDNCHESNRPTLDFRLASRGIFDCARRFGGFRWRYGRLADSSSRLAQTGGP